MGREKLRCEKAHFENQEITTRTFHTQLLQIQMADRLGRTAQNLQRTQKAPHLILEYDKIRYLKNCVPLQTLFLYCKIAIFCHIVPLENSLYR